MTEHINERIQQLEEKGVIILDPRQTYIAAEVDPARIYPGSTLHPGARLTGARTLVGTGAQIGSEGPAVIHDSVIGTEAEVASGFLSGSTLLPRAKAGANAHFRPGTLLEEEASTAHAVGLKQTILMYSVTLGSLINFCDGLISGGRSRSEHSEVGSGFIHFNFTPWGKNGDKATPSLVGNVTEGVFLDQERVFLGGMSGMVGPLSIGFGAMTVAGQVVRKSVDSATMHAEVLGEFDREWCATEVSFSEKRLAAIREKNLEFIAQLYALREWYTQIRLKRSREQENAELGLIYAGAIETIEECINERVKRYNSFAKAWMLPVLAAEALTDLPEFAGGSGAVGLTATQAGQEGGLDWKPELAYDQWIWGLAEPEKEALHSWLVGCVQQVKKEYGL